MKRGLLAKVGIIMISNIIVYAPHVYGENFYEQNNTRSYNKYERPRPNENEKPRSGKTMENLKRFYGKIIETREATPEEHEMAKDVAGGILGGYWNPLPREAIEKIDESLKKEGFYEKQRMRRKEIIKRRSQKRN